MQTISIEVRPRHITGSAVAKKIRRAGLIPVNLYGKGFSNRNVVVDPKVLARAFRGPFGRNQLLEISIAGEEGKHLAIAKEIQLDPITRKLKHTDLFVLQPDTGITVTLPVKLEGRSEGEKIGGRVNFVVREVKAKCTPATLPTNVTVEMAPLQVGDSLLIDSVKFPDGVDPFYKKKFKILDILPPKGGTTEEGEEEKK